MDILHLQISDMSLSGGCGESLKNWLKCILLCLCNKLEIRVLSNPKTFQGPSLLFWRLKCRDHTEAYQLRPSAKAQSALPLPAVRLILYKVRQLIDFAGKTKTTSELKIPMSSLDDRTDLLIVGCIWDVKVALFRSNLSRSISIIWRDTSSIISLAPSTDDRGWRIEIKKYPLLTQVEIYPS